MSGAVIKKSMFIAAINWKFDNLYEFAEVCKKNELPLSISDMTASEFQKLVDAIKLPSS